MTSQFGALLRRLRLRAGMKQEGLAECSGVGVRTIRGLETGERTNPRVETVRLLADALGLEPDERDELVAAAVGQVERGRLTHEQTSEAVDQSTSALRDRLAGAADLLAQAVRARWQQEEEQRRIQYPFPLSVRWQPAAEDVTDHWSNIRRAPAGTISCPLALAGQLDEVVDVYRRIPSGRLVVLGRAGSGKTMLALRFVLDLLRSRSRADAVPVIFSLGSWNPTTTALRDWLTDQLVRDHPGLAQTGPGTSTLAAALVEGGHILPVLDGFDEIADGLHRAALEALNVTTLSLLLTSRPTEYAAAVAATDVLTSAAGIELTNLTLTDLADYLPRTTRKATPNDTGTVWDPVLNLLRDQPQSPASVNLAAVLTTPLMVALARTIYSDTPDHNPSTLLDTSRFPTPEALEDHLLDNFIPTVYRHHSGNRPAGYPRRWDPERAQRWLGYLAHHLDHLGTRDLAWWQLGNSMRRSTRMLVVGLMSGLAFGLMDGLVLGLMSGLAFGLMYGLVNGLVNGLVGGLVSGLAFGLVSGLVSGGAAFEPSRVRVQILGGTGQMRVRFLPRLVVGFMGGFGFGLVFWPVDVLMVGLVSGLVSGAKFGFVFLLVNGLIYGLVNGLIYGLVVGFVFGLMAGLEAPIDIRSAASPSDLLNTNRTTVVFQLLVVVLVFGLVGGLIFWLGGGLVNGLVFALVGGLGGGLGYGLSLTAWGRWVSLSRMWLPLTGRLPWAVIAFLDDAYQRGVLRQAGAVYQFRHARLQDHLTHDFLARRDQPPASSR